MWLKEWYGKTARLALLLINYLGIGIIQLFSFSHEEKEWHLKLFLRVLLSRYCFLVCLVMI